MRDNLAACSGKRIAVSATFLRYGSKPGWKGSRPVRTLLFIDVRDMHDKVICDHIWFSINKKFEALHLVSGERVKFDARSTPYRKGYRGNRDDYELEEHPTPSMDYKLSHPTNVRKVGAKDEAAEELDLFGTVADRRQKTENKNNNLMFA